MEEFLNIFTLQQFLPCRIAANERSVHSPATIVLFGLLASFMFSPSQARGAMPDAVHDPPDSVRAAPWGSDLADRHAFPIPSFLIPGEHAPATNETVRSGERDRFPASASAAVLSSLTSVWFRRTLLSQEYISVIDTATVYDVSDTTRYIYEYDGSVRKIFCLAQHWLGGSWRNAVRYTYILHANGKTLSDISEVWKDHRWVFYAHITYSFDSQGRLLSILFRWWQDDRWVNAARTFSTYTPDGNESSWLQEQWIDGRWKGIARYTCTYDKDGNRLSRLFEIRESGPWTPATRENAACDERGNVLSTLFERWTVDRWEGVTRAASTYDSHDRLLSVVVDSWEWGQWDHLSRESRTYISDGKRQSVLVEQWAGGQWVKDILTTFAYNERGNEVLRLQERWRDNSWEWGSRAVYMYDGNGDAIEASFDEWDGDSWAPMHDYFLQVDSAGNTHIYFGYSIILDRHSMPVRQAIVAGAMPPSGEMPEKTMLMQNYPNPFNPTTHLRFTICDLRFVSLNVYDILGQKVATLVNEVKEPGEYTISWEAKGLPSGIYFYRLEATPVSDATRRFSQTRKMVFIR